MIPVIPLYWNKWSDSIRLQGDDAVKKRLAALFTAVVLSFIPLSIHSSSSDGIRLSVESAHARGHVVHRKAHRQSYSRAFYYNAFNYYGYNSYYHSYSYWLFYYGGLSYLPYVR